tara:strand:+ start:11599 stop:11982 length:384 start_codon:yes stop_codon:yes gene_type:complete
MKLVTADLLDIHHYPFGSSDPNEEKIASRLFLPPVLTKPAQTKIRTHLTNYFIAHRKMPDELAIVNAAKYRLRFFFKSPYHHHGRGKLGYFDEERNHKLPLENLADCYFMDNGKTIELHIFDNMTFS